MSTNKGTKIKEMGKTKLQYEEITQAREGDNVAPK
jgi:hypothetical protein